MADMDITEVLAHLPQRYPFLMIDRVLECEPGKRILAAEERVGQRAVFPRAFPGPPDHARRADPGGHGAGGLHPGVAHQGRPGPTPTPSTTTPASTTRASSGRWCPATSSNSTCRSSRTSAASGNSPASPASPTRWSPRPRSCAPSACWSRSERSAGARDGDRPPRRAARAGREHRRLFHHRRARGARRGHLGRAARGHRGPYAPRAQQPHLPVRLDRRAAAGQEVRGRAHGGGDRRRQHDPRGRHHQPRHRGGRAASRASATTTG